MLEMADDGDDDYSAAGSAGSDGDSDGDPSAVTLPEPVSMDAIDQHSQPEQDGNWNEQIPNELPVDTQWEDVYQTSASSLPSQNEEDWDYTSRTGTGETLQSHLEWQLNLIPMSETDYEIAAALIDGSRCPDSHVSTKPTRKFRNCSARIVPEARSLHKTISILHWFLPDHRSSVSALLDTIRFRALRRYCGQFIALTISSEIEERRIPERW